MSPNAVASLILFASLTGCSHTPEANKKVKESNTAMEEANKLEREGIDSAKEAKSKFGTDQESAVAPAKTCSEKLDAAASKVDGASKLLKEASDLKLEKTFTDYLGTMSRADAKVADRIRSEKSLCDVIAARPSADDLDAAFDKATADTEAREKEANELLEQADKIRRENPAKFDQ